MNSATHSGRRVLVAQADADNRELYVAALKLEGFVVDEAEDGVQVWEKAVAAQPDVIVTGLSLRKLDGCQLADRVKADDRTKQARLIAVTADARRSQLERARRHGFDAIFTKPCDPNQLLAEIDRLLGPPRP